MEHVIGVDLGTTFSAVAFVNEATGRAEILADPETQERITPSVVFFENESNIIVGKIAKANAIAEPEKVVEFVKRRIGSDWKFTLGSRQLTPQEISAHILRKLKQDAENRLNEEISKAVITVPAYFGEAQRAATKEAGRLAGFEVLEILDEPVAAALAYGLDRSKRDQTVFVFDLGGGTLDVTIIEIEANQIREVAIDGDHQLGGKDWDDALITYLAGEFESQFGSRPLDDLATYQDLQLRAIEAKEQLSRMGKVRVTVQHAGNITQVELTREKFEKLTKPLVDRCEMLCESVLRKTDKSWDDIDTLLFVGGSTRMPMIGEMLVRISGKTPSTDVNPDQCVAEGAAWEALIAQTQGDPVFKEKWAATNPAAAQKVADVKVQKITSHDIGVVALKDPKEKRSFLMIPKFTPVPHEVSDSSFATAFDNQDAIEVEVTEGGFYLDEKDCDPATCEILGKVTVEGIPPHPAGSPVEITLKITGEKLVEATARDVVSDTSATATIQVKGLLTEAELKEAQHAVQRAKVTS